MATGELLSKSPKDVAIEERSLVSSFLAKLQAWAFELIIGLNTLLD